MYQLILESNKPDELYGVYETEKEARAAIVSYCNDIDFKSYYWNCYICPDSGDEHIDFGSYTHFFRIHEVEING